jgi:tetratricopeptide (TPR) repeat protein
MNHSLTNRMLTGLLVVTSIVLFLLIPPAVQAQGDVRTTVDRLFKEVKALTAAGRYREAIPLSKQLVEIAEEWFGPEDPHTATSLNDLAALYKTIGAYAEAEPLYKRALAIREKVLGPEHPDTAVSLNNLAVLYEDTGAYAKAEPLYKRALAIFEKTLGPENPSTASSLTNFGLFYEAIGAYTQAEPLLKRALAIKEKVLGPEHPDTAFILNSLAELYRATGAYAQAEPLSKRALTIREKTLGPDHPSTATSFNNLAGLYQATGAYGLAEELYKRALAIREKTLGPEHPDTATSLNNLASLYQATGEYRLAEELYKQALKIKEKTRGLDHPDTALSMNNLAELYRATGSYAQSESLYKQALAIRENTLGPEHPDTAMSLNNLASLYATTGAHAQAEPLFQRALVIRKKKLGSNHPETAKSLQNLAFLYKSAGDYSHAEPLYKQAIAIWETVLGPEHPDTALSLNNLAGLYRASGAYAQAEPLYKRALAIREKTLGPEHPDTALSLNNLAAFYQTTGAHAQSEELYKRALTIWERVFGAEHPDAAAIWENLALLSWRQGRWSESAARIQRSVTIEEANARRVLALGDESRKRAYVATLASGTDAVLSLSLAFLGKVSSAGSLGLEVVLQRKGRVQDVMADSFAGVRASLSAADRRSFEQWREVNAQLATLTFRGPERMPVTKYRELLDQLKVKIESLEADLSHRSAEFRTQVETVTVERVQRSLRAGEALVEWFRYQPFNPEAKGKEPRWGLPRYVAHVLKREGQPVAVDVGEAKPIETAISDLLGTLRDRGTLTIKLARELDARLMQPLRPHLGDAEHILLSPDGMLNLLPFGVLRDEQGRYLVREKQLTYLTSGRDLLRLASAKPSRQAPIILADPDFGPVSGTTLAAVSEPRRSTELSRGALSFNQLPGTAAEAKALKAALELKDEQVLTRAQATEAALKQVKGPRILHLATHGFFLADQPADLDAVSHGHSTDDRLLAPKGQNPMLRSGLALAGANQLRSGNDDGILTALEVVGLDLAGTELVVLSACETGIGEIDNGEGVFGLRRALVLAGVRTQVASLWKVDDDATKDLMIDYYKRLSNGEGRSQALREAQLAMLKDPKRADPYYWAAFVVIGDGAPLTP